MSQSDPCELVENQEDVIADALGKLESVSVVRGCFLMEGKAGGNLFEHLPIGPAIGRGQNRKVILRRIKKVPAQDLDPASIEAIIKEGRWTDLPNAIELREEPKGLSEMQIHAGPDSGGSVDVLMMMRFSGAVKDGFVDAEKAKRLFGSDAELFQFKMPPGVAPNQIFHVFQYILLQLPRQFAVVVAKFGPKDAAGEPSGKKTKRVFTADEIDDGYDYMFEFGPRSNTNNMQNRWIMKQMNDSASPLFGWMKADIKEGLANLMNERCLAPTQTYFPICLMDLHVDFRRKVLRLLLPVVRTTGVLLLGVQGNGKSPALVALAMALSRYYIERDRIDAAPGFRQASDLDFFRGEAGQLHIPCIHDDGDLDAQKPKALKAFYDVSLVDAMTRERWGAAKFVKNQPRSGAENKHKADLDFEVGQNAAKDLENFGQLTRPAFPERMGEPDIDAVKKRTSICVNTKNYVYLKLAGDNVVHRFEPMRYVTEEAIVHLKRWTLNKTERDFGTLIEAEQAHLKEVFKQQDDAIEKAGRALDDAGVGFDEGDDPFFNPRSEQVARQAAETAWIDKELAANDAANLEMAELGKLRASQKRSAGGEVEEADEDTVSYITQSRGYLVHESRPRKAFKSLSSQSVAAVIDLTHDRDLPLLGEPTRVRVKEESQA